jgi:hypothetical protein
MARKYGEATLVRMRNVPIRSLKLSRNGSAKMKTEKSVKHPRLRRNEVHKARSQTRHGAHTAPIGIGAAIGQGALRAFHHRAFRPCHSAIAARDLRPTKLPDRAGHRNRQERDCKHGVPYVDVPTGMWLRPNVVRGISEPIRWLQLGRNGSSKGKRTQIVKHPELRQNKVHKAQSQTKHGAHTAPIGIGAAIGRGALRAFHQRAFRPCHSTIASTGAATNKPTDRAG